MREWGVNSIYLPKNAIGCSEAAWLNTKRYVPPVRTSTSHETKDIPHDFGAHHRLSNSGLVQASNRICAGPWKVRVTTSSRSDFRSTVVGFFIGAHFLFFRTSTLSSRFNDSTILSNSSKRASQSWRHLSTHAASSSRRRRPSFRVSTQP